MNGDIHVQARRWLGLAVLGLLLVSARSASAEGTAQLGITQALQNHTLLYVDILDPAQEVIRWEGTGSLRVTSPLGQDLGTYDSGTTIDPVAGQAGAYALRMTSSQSTSTAWSIRVTNSNASVTKVGRLFSYDWNFNTGSFASTHATNASFYALVPGGKAGTDAVIELRLAGLAGYVYTVNANRSGVEGTNAGKSVPESGNSVVSEFPIYLQPPEKASFGSVTPSLTGFGYSGSTVADATGPGGSGTSCDEIVSGGSSLGRFSFNTDAVGTYHLQCDLNKDGVFDETSADDLALVGKTTVGDNTVTWDGTLGGAAVPNGSYDCRLLLTVGEFHYVGRDIETSYPGMRIYEVAANGDRRPLPMFWNDSLVQSKAVTMDNGAIGLESSGIEGILPGAYSDAAVPNVNARSWGAWAGSGKGNASYLDTFVYVHASTSTTISLAVVDPNADSDGDGLSDFAERCTYGSDPQDSDTDNDGVPDGSQYVDWSADSDGDGVPDGVDQAPCDSAVSSFLYYPSESGFAQLMVEDQWPARGDYDYNDLVLAYQLAYEQSSSGKTKRLHLRLVPRARGAGRAHGLAWRLPLPAGTVATVTRQVDGGAATTLTPEGTSVEDELVVRISADTKELFADGAAGLINTQADRPVYAGRFVEITVEFATPQELDSAAAPHDLFIYRSADFGHQIHDRDHQGTKQMTLSLFNTAYDASGGDGAFVGKNGLPYLLHVPVTTPWPREGQDIGQVFGRIVDFALSGGTQDVDWYLSFNTLAFTRGLGDSLPVAPSFPSGSGGVSSAPLPCSP